jgi:hypothetical protein
MFVHKLISLLEPYCELGIRFVSGSTTTGATPLVDSIEIIISVDDVSAAVAAFVDLL